MVLAYVSNVLVKMNMFRTRCMLFYFAKTIEFVRWGNIFPFCLHLSKKFFEDFSAAQPFLLRQVNKQLVHDFLNQQNNRLFLSELMDLFVAETSQQPISQTTWLKVTPHCNHCNHWLFAVSWSRFICDLRFRHLKVWREADFSCPRAVNKKAVTYHKWCGSSESGPRVSPFSIPSYLYKDLDKHVLRNFSRFRLRAHHLRVESCKWHGNILNHFTALP